MLLEHRHWPAWLLALLILAGCSDSPPVLPGTLEWDRIALPAEVSEPVLRWAVDEGDRVSAGDVLLELDGRRLEARLEAARGDLARTEAQLAELTHGPREETIDAARADLERAQTALEQAERDYRRSSELRRQNAIAQATFEQARASRDQLRAEVAALEARLRELIRGERPERIAQAAAEVAAAKARLEELRLDRERLIVRAPRNGRVDALPFHPGDQPPVGATLASLLVGKTPYARIFVPISQRATLAPGDRVRIHVEGIEAPFDAHLESIRSEPAFTPFYALVGDDASRLVYRAEARLEGEAARRLPAGLPISAELADDR
ncbi:membrane protein [Litchfieldella qijiaojingensis]|uniref:Membrane protein n=1 Tax=Litchfieldella qijiaojingensis TaxID=980347 RepID=A0ABQ2ZA74_9GAMM|nr:HlyD family efflux transporter periplasmic adaptor subunit [Halomonas qijiaojingensis]GGY07467.1 membrane protein [Halomonas qijiaojingensis]